MFSVRRRHWILRFRSPWPEAVVEGDAGLASEEVVATVGNAMVLEYTMGGSPMHYAMDDGRCQFTMGGSPMHYGTGEGRMHYEMGGTPAHYDAAQRGSGHG